MGHNEDVLGTTRSRAVRAVAEKDWIAAASLWLDVLRLGDANRGPLIQAALSLRQAGRFAEADEVLRAAAACYPNDFDIALEYAWVAHSAEDWDEAELRWKALREAFPDNPSCYVYSALSLRMGMRRGQADAILLAAITRFPRDLTIFLEYAWTAHWAGDHVEAGIRWAAVRSRFPDRPEGFAFGAATLRDSDDFQAARAMLDAARATFPDDMQIWIESLLTDLRTGAFSKVVTESKALRETVPDRVEGYRFGAWALRELGRYEDAERLVLDGLVAVPGNPELLIEHARAAEGRRDWFAARQRWDLILAQFPGNPEARSALAELILKQNIDSPDETPTSGQSLATISADASLMLRFESLCDDCEFGIVQRRYGAEPLALLRWAGIQPDALIRGLQTDFSEIDGSGHVEIEATDGGEYLAQVGTMFRMHTNYHVAQIDAATLKGLMERRVRFLRRMLLDSLVEGNKIFVVKQTEGRMTSAQAREIATAVRRHGPARVLWVQEATAECPPGTAVTLDDNLITGFVEILPKGPNTVTPYETWLRLLRVVADMVDGAPL